VLGAKDISFRASARWTKEKVRHDHRQRNVRSCSRLQTLDREYFAPGDWLDQHPFEGWGRQPGADFVFLGSRPKATHGLSRPAASFGDGVTLKDTFVNIRDTGEFVANIATLERAHQMHQTAFEFPPEADEFVEVGLQKAPSEVVRVPRVEGAPISMECRVNKIIPVGQIGDHVVLGEVLRFHVRDDLYLARGRIDTAAIHSVGRLAAEYTLVENVFITPLDLEVLSGRAKTRMHRLDGHADGWSPIDTKPWSPSGSMFDVRTDDTVSGKSDFGQVAESAVRAQERQNEQKRRIIDQG
jgi:flavin reductase (DIM6/NTAB) family NADH-FMN oxidoreductase RutF